MKTQTLLRILVGLTENGVHGVSALTGISPSSLSRHAALVLKSPRVLRHLAEFYSEALDTPVNESLLSTPIDPKVLVAVADLCNRQSLASTKKQ